MVVRVSRTTLKPLGEGLYTVSYWNQDWDELMHLRLENAGPVEAVEALQTWFRERDLIRAGKLSSSVLVDAVAITVGRADEED